MGGISWMNWSTNLDDESGSEESNCSNENAEAGSKLVPKKIDEVSVTLTPI
jgi:hypothetical protein